MSNVRQSWPETCQGGSICDFFSQRRRYNDDPAMFLLLEFKTRQLFEEGCGKFLFEDLNKGILAVIQRCFLKNKNKFH